MKKKRLLYRTNNLPLVLKFTVHTATPLKIRLVVSDLNRPNTKYTDRFNTIEGTETFYVRMPQSPEIAEIYFISEEPEYFKIIKKEVVPLRTQMSAFDFKDSAIVKYILFAQEFAERAGYLSTGLYYNKTGEYELKFMPAIKDIFNDKELNTPARINAKTGQIQVSDNKFKKFTVPGRFAILLHEFCHVFKNKDVKSEIEADFHAAQIYLALGYPRVELLNVFANVFLRADTDLNRKRFDKLYNYIMEFDNRIISVKYA